MTQAGGFSGRPACTIYNPFTGNPDGTNRVPFPNNIIPQNLISPIAQKLQAYYPEPNLPGIANNYYASGGPILNRYQEDINSTGIARRNIASSLSTAGWTRPPAVRASSEWRGGPRQARIRVWATPPSKWRRSDIPIRLRPTSC